jgi:hypothetical protein
MAMRNFEVMSDEYNVLEIRIGGKYAFKWCCEL